MFIFGLGNPGEKYNGTRHNVGFMVVEKIASQLGVHFHKKLFNKYLYAKIEDKDDILIKPLTYMNSSGSIIPSLIKNGEKLLVISDQMDLPCGRIKIKEGGGSAGHNGLKSIIEYYGEDFIHFYIGIDHPEKETSVIDHVLSHFKDNEIPLINSSIERASDAVIQILDGVKLKEVCESVNRRG